MLYFNYAGLSPTRTEAAEEQAQVQARFDAMLFSERGVVFYMDKLDACRAAVADLLHVSDPHDIAFVQNASIAAGIILSSLDILQGDTIITSDQEHPSVTAPLAVLAAKGVNVVTLACSSTETFLSSLEETCSSRHVRLVMISHVSYKDGRMLPIERAASIARASSAFIVVDGAQAVGHVPVNLDALDVDAYFFSGHKWCFGPMGTGALFVANKFISATQPLWIGWAAKTDREQHLAKRLEIGTQNIGLIAGLAKACQLKAAEMTNPERVLRHRRTVMEFIHNNSDIECIAWGGEHAPAILSFSSRRGIAPDSIVDHLFRRHRIVVKPINYPEEPSCVRLSWSSLTTEHDIAHLLAKLDECLQRVT